MKKNLSLATILIWILTSFIFSCANMNRQNAEGMAAGGLARAPQSEQTVGEDLGLEDKLEKAFEAAMNPSLDSIEEYREPGLDEKIAIDRARSKSMSKYIKRQIGMFHIAQELVIGFDEQLDRVHRKLMQQRKVDSSIELSEVDKMPLLEARIKLNVAWEFS